MLNLLNKHGIPADTISNAVCFLNSADDDIVTAFNHEFGLTMEGDDALSAARFAADAIFRGATSVAKVVGYVAKRMTGQADTPQAKTVVMVGAPTVETAVDIVQMHHTDPEGELVAVKGKRGRKRLGNSDFAKAVSIIQTNHLASRQTVIDCLIAANIKESSAAVYYWRYHTKGERE